MVKWEEASLYIYSLISAAGYTYILHSLSSVGFSVQIQCSSCWHIGKESKELLLVGQFLNVNSTHLFFSGPSLKGFQV